MRKFVAHPTTVVKAFTNPWDMNDEDLEDYENSGDRYVELDSKQVLDSDGFMTDYTMYRDTVKGDYVFMFGDKDEHRPEEGYFDWSCNTEEEAWDWYNSYNGFEDEDDIYLSTAIKANSYDASKIQKYINSYGFNNYVVYDRDENWCAIDFEGEDEDDVIPLVNRIKAIIPETSIFEHYIEMYVGSATAIKAGYDDDQMVRCPYCTQLTSREIVRKYGMCWDCYDNNVE